MDTLMRLRGLDGRAILTAVCLGLSLGMSGYAVYRSLAPPPNSVSVDESDTEQTVVARTDLPAQTILAGTDLEPRRVKTDQMVPGALRDLTISDHIRLLAPVRAGQQIVAFLRD